MVKNVIALSLSTFALLSTPVFAYTECIGKITNIAAADDGSLVVVTDRAPVATYMSQNKNLKAITATALTALASDKYVSVRFTADAVPCNSNGAGRYDSTHLWVIR